MPFWNNRKSNEIHQAMARLINNSFSIQQEYSELAAVNEQRLESRSKRIFPVAVFKTDDVQDSVVIGFTRDVSLEGMAVVTNQGLGQKDLILVVGERQARFVLFAELVSARSIGFGCFQSGLRLKELLQRNAAIPILDYVESLESSHGSYRDSVVV